MSIRQYRPAGRSRRGMTNKQSIFAYSLFAVTVGLQILYPLVHGGLLRIVTLLFVYAGALAILTHAFYSYGFKYLFLYLTITFAFALAIEEIGSRTGWPFGEYQYSPTLGFAIYDVPFVVPFAWVMMAHPMLIVARKISSSWAFLIGGVGLMVWDFFVDPQMVAAGRWSWKAVNQHVPLEPTIPLSNAVGWLLGGMALIAILHRVLPKGRRKVGASTALVDLFLLWTVISGIIGNIFFFHTPGVAIMGGIPFTILLIFYLLASRLGRPDQF